MKTLSHFTLPASKAKIVLGSSFVIFVVSAIAIFIGFQYSDRPHTDTYAEMQLEPEAPVSFATAYDDFDNSAGTQTDNSASVSDFGKRLDAMDERLRSMEQTISQLKDELSNYSNINSEAVQSVSAELQALKHQISNLTATDNTLSHSIKQIKASMQSIEGEQHQDSQNELPVAGLKLLSVSIWDDGAVAIVSLGNRRTGLSVGNFFAGLKVEDISVAEQSLTLYEPVRDKLYTLYADSIVYKEVYTP